MAKLLASVAELELSVVDGNIEVPEVGDLLTSLNEPSLTADPSLNLTKVDVLYESALLRTTVSSIVFDLEEVLYREEALFEEEFAVSETSNKNIAKIEISNLVKLVNKLVSFKY